MGRRRRHGRHEHSGITASLTLVPLDGTPTDTEVTRPYVLDWRMLEEPTLKVGLHEIRATQRRERPPKPPPLRRRRPPRVESPPQRSAEATQIIQRRLPMPTPTPLPPPPERSLPELGLVVALFVMLVVMGTLIALLLRPLVAHSAVPRSMHAAALQLRLPTIPVETAVSTPAVRPAAPATLSFRSKPQAAIVLDGKTIGHTPKRDIRVAAGEHLVQFFHRRLGRRDQRVTVEAGGTRAVIARF